MTSTRLNVHMRTELLEFAKKHVEASAEKTALDAAYKAVAKPIREAVDEKFPPKDMKVLERYGCAGIDRCINRYQMPEDRRFIYHDTDKLAPLLPSKGGCQDRKFEWPPELQAKLSEWHLARDAHNKARAKKLLDYQSLIHSSRTFEEVAELWPAIEIFRTKFITGSNAVIALNPEVIERIKSDNAGADAMREAA